MKNIHKNNLTNIQMLRAFAAINVVILHIFANASIYGFSKFNTTALWQNWGKCGVDIFFVISGFIMVYTQYHKQYSPARFFLNRAIRILPVYWVLLFIVISMHLFLPGAFLKTHFELSWAINSFFLTSQFFQHRWPMIFDAWTLEFEMLFYVLFAASLFISQLRFSLITTAALIILCVVITHYTIMLEFLFGMIVGVLFIYRKMDTRISIVVLLVGAILLFSSLVFPIQTIHRVILWGIPAMMIVFGLVNLPQYKNTLLMKLGDASYSIYLFQVFAYLLFYKTLTLLHASHRFDVLYMIVCVFFTVSCGYLIYLTLELKLTAVVKRCVFQKRKFA